MFRFQFGNVRIHDDAEADRAARSLGAAAFTMGRDLFFRAGRYDPTTTAGRWLIAHELAHVVQQSGRSGGTRAEGASPAEHGATTAAGLERDATRAADAVTTGARPAVAPTAAAGAVQCESEEELRAKLADVQAKIDAYRARIPQLEAAAPKQDTWEVTPSGKFKRTDWRATRAGVMKGYYNLLEERDILKLRLQFPDYEFLEQVSIGRIVTPSGEEFQVPERIPDWALVSPDGKNVFVGDKKTIDAITHSMEGGIPRNRPVTEDDLDASFRTTHGNVTRSGKKPSRTQFGDQVLKERYAIKRAEALGGKLVIRGKRTDGTVVEREVEPSALHLSRLNPYGQIPDKLLDEPVTPKNSPPVDTSGSAPPTTEPATPKTETAAKADTAAPKAEPAVPKVEPAPPQAPSRTQTTTEPEPATTARVGMPDMVDIHVGGPSAKGEAVGGAVMLGAQAKDAIMDWLVDRTQSKLVDEAMARKVGYIRAVQKDHPELGAYVTIYRHVTRGNEGESTRRFEDISVKMGVSELQARQSPEQSFLNVSGSAADTEVSSQWFPAPKPLPLDQLPTPYDKIAVARFAPGNAKLQGAKWGGRSGFDTWKRGNVDIDLRTDLDIQFAVLAPPKTIDYWNGDVGVGIHNTKDISIKDELTANDYFIPVISDLDAALVYPLTGDTQAFFHAAKRIHDLTGQLRGDFDEMRWVPAKNVYIEHVLDPSAVKPRPPTEDEKVQRAISVLPLNAQALLQRMMTGKGRIKLTPEAIARFEAIVPPDLSDTELRALVGRLRPIEAEQNLDGVFKDLQKAVDALPGRHPPEPPALTASADDVATIKNKLHDQDWTKLPVAGIYFSPGPIGLPAGTHTSCFAYGYDKKGRHYGALVEIDVGKAEGNTTPITVTKSTQVLMDDGTVYAPAENLAGHTYRLKTLADLAHAHGATGAEPKTK